MNTNWIVGLSALTMLSCAGKTPTSIVKAEKAVDRAEEKDADDLTPRMMEMAHAQLEKAEELWDQSVEAREDKKYVKAHSLARQSNKLANSARALSQDAVAIGADVVSWDKNPTQYSKVMTDAARSSELSARVGKLRARTSSYLNTMVNVDAENTAALKGLVNQMPVAYFPSDSAEPKSDYMPNAKRLAKFLKANGSLQVELTGFADPRGGEKENNKLAKARAEAVRDILSSEGVSKSRIAVISSGEVGKLAKADPAQLQLYRKVEATLVQR